MSVADDLRAAKALIDTPEKWGKGAELSERHVRCVALALDDSATEGYPPFFEVARHIPDAELKPGYEVLVLTRFNDDPATTHADIMALFDRAINAAEPTRTADGDAA